MPKTACNTVPFGTLFIDTLTYNAPPDPLKEGPPRE
jgi:hypothetical protein